MKEWISDIPKIELHCHLDGSISLPLAAKLLSERGENYTVQELRAEMTAPADCGSLTEYLRCFDLPNQVLQQPYELIEAAKDLALCAAKENVRYIEVRFAPQFSTAEGLGIRKVLESVIEGLSQARTESGIESGVIVCGMRGLSEEANLAMLREAAELFGAGVVACDLAGDEKYYPLSQYAYFFEQAKKYGMPFTIHAGECGSRENIRMAIEMGARRIGHGIAMLHDKQLQQLCAKKRIGVELCPTSNLQTQAISSIKNYPLREFMENGVPISINTDNRTVSGTSMTHEFEVLQEAFALSEDECRRIYEESAEVSFRRFGSNI
ncbi:MAG: adenosine deaminase [Clostridiales bacterium]|nr:adenosine deaminase [Clostridiales bacterium]